MKLSKKDRSTLLSILSQMQAAQAYVRNPRVLVCSRKSVATTTLDLSSPDGRTVCTPVDVEIGSDLAQLHAAVGRLSAILFPASL